MSDVAGRPLVPLVPTPDRNQPEFPGYDTARPEYVPPTSDEIQQAKAIQGNFGDAFARSEATGRNYDASLFDKILSITPQDAVDYLHGKALPQFTPTDLMKPEEANKEFAPKGEKWFDQPISAGLAREYAKERVAKEEAESTIERYNNTTSWRGLGWMWPTVLADINDPVGTAMNFIPGIGEEVTATRLGGGLVARMAGAGVAGASGAGAATGLEVAMRLGHDPDYTMFHAFRDLAIGAATGAVVQGLGVQGLKELFKWRVSPTQAEAGVRSAVANLVDERPPDVTGIIYPPASDLDVAAAQAEATRRGMSIPKDKLADVASIYAASKDWDFSIAEAEKVKVPQTIAEVAEARRALEENGYAPGMTNSEVRQAELEVKTASEAEEVKRKLPKEVSEVLSGPQPLLGQILARPDVQEAIRNMEVERHYDIPYMAGTDLVEPNKVYIDSAVPHEAVIDGKTITKEQLEKAVGMHEIIEKYGMQELIRRGLSESQAYVAAHHLLAEIAERDYVENVIGVSWKGYQDWWKSLQPTIQGKENPISPITLYRKPYPQGDERLAKTEETGPVRPPNETEKAVTGATVVTPVTRAVHIMSLLSDQKKLNDFMRRVRLNEDDVRKLLEEELAKEPKGAPTGALDEIAQNEIDSESLRVDRYSQAAQQAGQCLVDAGI